MKAIVNSTLFRKEFEKISGIISQNTVLPILSCVKLDFDKIGLTISATDLETTIISKIGCECKTPFVTVVDFDSIANIFKKLPDQPVMIEEKEKSILIEADNYKGKLPKGGGDKEFPNIPEESFSFSVEVNTDFFEALYNADSAKHTDDARVSLNTACLDFKKDILTVVGTDALVLYQKDLKIKSGKIWQSLVRGKFVKVVKGFEKGVLSAGEKFVKVQQGDTVVITRVQDNKYCQYDKIIPVNPVYNLKVNRIGLIAAINRISTTADKATKTLALNFSDSKIRLYSQDIDFAKEGETTIPAIHSVGIESIGVSGSQLSQILSYFDSADVDIAIPSATHTITLKQPYDDSVLCLLQPITLL